MIDFDNDTPTPAKVFSTLLDVVKRFFFINERILRTELPFMSLVSDAIRSLQFSVTALLLMQYCVVIITMCSSVLLDSKGLAYSGVVRTTDVLNNAFPNSDVACLTCTQIEYWDSDEMWNAEQYLSNS